MKPIIYLLTLLLITSITSCKMCKKDTVQVTETTTTTPAEEIKKLIVDKSGAEPASASTDIVSISIEGNILSIVVSYSGGCEEHEFNLYFDGNYKKSLPPKAQFSLQHEPHNDPCRSIVEKTLKFDISESQYVGQKEIMVSVSGLVNEISYKY